MLIVKWFYHDRFKINANDIVYMYIGYNKCDNNKMKRDMNIKPFLSWNIYVWTKIEWHRGNRFSAFIKITTSLHVLGSQATMILSYPAAKYFLWERSRITIIQELVADLNLAYDLVILKSRNMENWNHNAGNICYVTVHLIIYTSCYIYFLAETVK